MKAISNFLAMLNRILLNYSMFWSEADGGMNWLYLKKKLSPIEVENSKTLKGRFILLLSRDDHFSEVNVMIARGECIINSNQVYFCWQKDGHIDRQIQDLIRDKKRFGCILEE